MKTIILAGGMGTRLSEYTDKIPKPMVKIGDKPILWHIMKTYKKYKFNEFIVALGYKGEVIKEYFINYKILNSNFQINLHSGDMKLGEMDIENWDVNLIDTGEKTLTGGRLLRLKKYIGNERFFLTYGDGVADIDIDELLEFHKKHKKMVTITAVRPPARFGKLKISKDKVLEFVEKPQMDEGWINGGFFVIEPEFLDFIDNDTTILEKEPLEKVASLGQLMAYKHEGFWQCMDTARDLKYLEDLWLNDNALWKA